MSVSLSSLKPNKTYTDKEITVEIIHLCPIDGEDESIENCKRIVVCKECPKNGTEKNDKHVIIMLYGEYVKTPFKKSVIRNGQTMTVMRFVTNSMPKKKRFVCGDKIISDFHDYFIKLFTDDNHLSIVKLIKDPNNKEVIRDGSDVNEFNDTLVVNIPSPKLSHLHRKTTKVTDTVIVSDTNVSPPLKRLKFGETLTVPSQKQSKDLHEKEKDKNDTTKVQPMNGQNKRPEQSQRSPVTNSPAIDTPLKNTPSKSAASTDTPSKDTPSTDTPSKYTNTNRVYEYKSLIDVHGMFPVSQRCYVNVYGIVTKVLSSYYKPQELYLCDETTSSFSVKLAYAKTSDRRKEYPAFYTGDCVRIHRMLLNPKLEKICLDPIHLVVFRGFNDPDTFEPIACSETLTIDDYDRNRKKEIEEWYCETLINNPLCELHYDAYINISGQVIGKYQYQNKTIIQLWDSTKVPIKTVPPLNLPNFTIFSAQDNDEMIRYIRENEMFLFVILYDEHSMDAVKIKIWDFIVIFNIKCQPHKRLTNFHECSLNSNYSYGKCMRIVNENSPLSKNMSLRIEAFKRSLEINVSSILEISDVSGNIQFPVQSQPFSLSVPNENDANERVSHTIEIDSRNADDKRPENSGETFESFVFPINRIEGIELPSKSISFDEFVLKGIPNQLYAVNARVLNYVPPQNLRDVISIVCPYEYCSRMIALSQAMNENAKLKTMIEENNRFDDWKIECAFCKERLLCDFIGTDVCDDEIPKCQFIFNMIIILMDANHTRIFAQLKGRDAESVFGMTPIDVINDFSKLNRIREILNYLCPNPTASAKIKTSNPNLKWILEPKQIGKNVNYKVRGVMPIERSNKSVGCKLNNDN